MYCYKTGLLQKVKSHLNHGGIIAYPTESCYGLGCNPFNVLAVNKLIKLKSRNKDKGVIVVASKKKQLNKLISPLEILDNPELNKYWPGAYSLILPTNRRTPKIVQGRYNKLAVRVSAHTGIQQLCNYLNMPLVSTSANRAGLKSIKTYRECVHQFGTDVMVLPGVIGFAKTPSTIIDWGTQQRLR